MKKLNYGKLMELTPTLYESLTNDLGQTFDLYEHPVFGDEYPVIIVHHESSTAVVSDFFDTSDLTALDGDYYPVLVGGEIKLKFETEYSNH